MYIIINRVDRKILPVVDENGNWRVYRTYLDALSATEFMFGQSHIIGLKVDRGDLAELAMPKDMPYLPIGPWKYQTE